MANLTKTSVELNVGALWDLFDTLRRLKLSPEIAIMTYGDDIPKSIEGIRIQFNVEEAYQHD